MEKAARNWLKLLLNRKRRHDNTKIVFLFNSPSRKKKIVLIIKLFRFWRSIKTENAEKYTQKFFKINTNLINCLTEVGKKKSATRSGAQFTKIELKSNDWPYLHVFFGNSFYQHVAGLNWFNANIVCSLSVPYSFSWPRDFFLRI